MNLDQTAAVLTALSVANSLVTVGRTEIAFWSEKWVTIDYADAEQAIHGHYAEGGAYQASRQHIGPADVIRLAVAERNRRTKRPEVIAPGCYEPDALERERLVDGSEYPAALLPHLEADARSRTGLEQCSDVLAQVAQRLSGARANGSEPTESDRIHQRALEEARASKRGRRS